MSEGIVDVETVLSKKYAIPIILYLYDNPKKICKKDIRDIFKSDRTVHRRLGELRGARLLQWDDNPGIQCNRMFVELTDTGKKVSKLLKEIMGYIE
jgi:DNA-binding HxlR family transcriptional regulator